MQQHAAVKSPISVVRHFQGFVRNYYRFDPTMAIYNSLAITKTEQSNAYASDSKSDSTAGKQ